MLHASLLQPRRLGASQHRCSHVLHPFRGPGRPRLPKLGVGLGPWHQCLHLAPALVAPRLCLAASPSSGRRCRPCGYGIVTIAHCNGAVTRVAMALSPPIAGIITLVTMALLPTPHWRWVACHCPCLWPTSQRHQGPRCCRSPLHWPGRCPPTAFVTLVASIALALVASLPTTQWRHCPRCAGVIQFPMLHSLQKALTPCPPLAGCCTDIAAVAVTSRLHRRHTAATASPLLQPSTPLQSRHRRNTVAPLWL